MLLIGSLCSDLLQIAHVHGVQIREVITVPEQSHTEEKRASALLLPHDACLPRQSRLAAEEN